MTKCIHCDEETKSESLLCINCDDRLSYPIDYVYQLLETFPKTRQVYHCGTVHTISNLDMYLMCSKCNIKIKLRAFGAPKEIQDIILLVKKWIES
jgi:hypothetical protein